jgi:hypothetical protein
VLHSKLIALTFAAAALAATACHSGDDLPPTGAGTGSGGGVVEPQVPPASPKANVRFKNGARLRQELTRILGIHPGELCKELDKFDCFATHTIVLGNAEAFNAGLYEPLPSTTATTPLAIDRVMLAACHQRVELDLKDPERAIVFAGLEIGDGKLTDVNAPAVEQVIDRLYQRALSRRVAPSEVAHHRDLYASIEAKGLNQTPAKDWATLSCYAVLTSLEMLFH